MKTALYIDLSVEIPFEFESEFIRSIKSELPEAETLDMDSGSDPMLFSYAAKMITDSGKSVLLIKAEAESSLRKVPGIAEALIKNKKKCLVFLEGENPILEKMLLPVQENYCKLNHLKEIIEKSIDFLR
jgi:hypothetical protein